MSVRLRMMRQMSGIPFSAFRHGLRELTLRRQRAAHDMLVNPLKKSNVR
jgi:hypothetical protein